MEDVHQEIEKVAYELWEKEGRMDGRDREYWLAAESIVRARVKDESEMISRAREEGEEASYREHKTNQLHKEGWMVGQETVKPGEGVEQQVTALLNKLLEIVNSVSGILQKTLSTITSDPQMLQRVIRPVGEVVASVGKIVERTVPEIGKALGTTVGQTVSEVGKAVGETVGGVTEVGKPVGKIVEGLAKTLGGGQEAKPEAGRSKEEMIRSLTEKLSNEQLMKKSAEELEALSKALESRKTA